MYRETYLYFFLKNEMIEFYIFLMWRKYSDIDCIIIQNNTHITFFIRPYSSQNADAGNCLCTEVQN